MKILFLVNQLLNVCGISKHFYHLLSGLKEFYPENDYFVICGGGDAIEKFERLGVKILVNENIRHETRTLRGYLKGTYDIYKFAKRNKIDIIHSHHHYAASMAQKAVKFLNSKTVFTNHGILPKIGLLNHFNADYFIAINEHIREYLLENKIANSQRISLIRLGFPKFEFEKKKNKKIKVISGGRFVKEKGFEDYIKAVSKLPSEVMGKVEFYLAGSGEGEANLKKLNYELNAGIEFLGEIEDFQIFLKYTDIFVMPTHLPEGFPTVIIEAGLSKNLLIASNFRGAQSVLSNQEALIFSIGDVETLTKLLSDAINNYDKYINKIEKLEKLMTEKFSIEEMTAKTYNFYQRILR